MSAPPPHILYIDDDEGLRRLVERALTRRGFRVSLAASGPEGVTAAAAEQFDLISVDQYMPGQDGLATLRQLQANGPCPPVVFVTGSDETRIAVAALKQGAADYVVKSVGDDFFDLLVSAFQQSLEKVRLAHARDAAEAALRASHARLEALLGEMNHRITNSLQLVSAFVHLQSTVLTDPAARAALVETQQRIQAIGHVHRRLYMSGDLEVVAMDDFLGALLVELERTWSTPISPRPLKLSADPIRFTPDRAVSIGVIVNELVSNACKYAYPPGAPGEVRISLIRNPDRDEEFVLTVADDGEGLPTDGSIKGTGLGTRLIRTMASGLGAEVAYTGSPSGGAVAELRGAI